MSAKTIAAIAKALIFSLVVGMAQLAAAATAQSDHPLDDKSKWITACKSDIERFCDEANLKQECLIAHWSKISSECRDRLGTTAGNRAGDGS